MPVLPDPRGHPQGAMRLLRHEFGVELFKTN